MTVEQWVAVAFALTICAAIGMPMLAVVAGGIYQRPFIALDDEPSDVMTVTLLHLENVVPLTDWYPADTKPTRIGDYMIRIPKISEAMNGVAHWDGKVWRDTSNGFECYFQALEWRGLTQELSA